jgi:hypothetical protein
MPRVFIFNYTLSKYHIVCHVSYHSKYIWYCKVKLLYQDCLRFAACDLEQEFPERKTPAGTGNPFIADGQEFFRAVTGSDGTKAEPVFPEVRQSVRYIQR